MAMSAQGDVLAERANEGLLNDDRAYRYEAFIDASDFIAILKLKALRNFWNRKQDV